MMYDLSIFIEGVLSWRSFIEFFTELLGGEGRDDTDDLGKRHVWSILGIDVIGIENPDLDDDQGIPFSAYHLQLKLIVANMDNCDECERFRLALARMLVVSVRKRWNVNSRLIRNLQTEIPIE
jgi:hypothetical protein